ncbi:small ribosomal subunit Rsm22 family protein [Microlunatus soli]|uniref:Small ribosomal subunit Rsm22 n=1 Tax=Microlunatus soli TaxID=630515 RepID=A0A1H1XIX4_9ACTN|nr:small ribosomal subunit Rsm22 family protein [Microlunatus soli]SDT09021.1 small ribosomal subunit Rsm22 [Microlunatus soli]
MTELPGDLAQALVRETRRSNHDQLGSTTGRLIDRYQADRPARPGEPIMAGDLEARAYAAYRMPATYAAIAAVLDQLPDAGEIGSHLDVAGGTGAALWAVADRWPRLHTQTVLEQAPAAIALGQRLAAAADQRSVRGARWQPTVLTGATTLPTADVITVGYLLSEIEPVLQQQVVAAAAAAAGQLLIIVEPGTKNGYRRIIAARDQLIAAGMRIIAPCPHDHRCPWSGQDRDWCHFAARVNRSATHRRAKGAELGYEDEKFSYLVAVPAASPLRPAAGRVLRHPRQPKGRVLLEVCRSAGDISDLTVAKRDAGDYKAARRTDWGDPWPPT